MSDSTRKPPLIAAAFAAMLVLTGCVAVAPTTTAGPSFTLAPGATATPVPVITPLVTLAPGVTLPPVTLPPPTLEPTATPEHPDWPPGALEPKQAIDHIGQSAIVCGKVNGANWVFTEKGHPTWINLGPAYPNLRFTAVVWGEQRREWSLSGKPDVIYLGHVICVTGVIEAFKSWAQIEDVSKADIQVIN